MNKGTRRGLAGGIMLLLAVAAWGMMRSSAAPNPAGMPSKRVLTAAAETASHVGQIHLSGELRARHQARLSFTVAGRIAQRPIAAGAAFDQGALLAALDPAPFDHRVAETRAAAQELQARLALARRELARLEGLRAAEAVSLDRLDAARSGVATLVAGHEQASVALAEARRARAEAELRAPFAGVVTAVLLEPQEYAQPGLPVVAIASRDALELHAEVPEALLAALPPGQAVEVVLPLAGRRLAGRVERLGLAAAGGRLFPVIVALEPDAAALPGMTAELLIPAAAPPALALPLAAVIDPAGGRPYVWAVRDGRVEAVALTVQGLHGDRVLADAALVPGEAVVVAGHGSLSAGSPVEIVR